ncbi:hypothetical protein AHAS_Ahas03G0120900 [Arachis hypogaea]
MEPQLGPGCNWDERKLEIWLPKELIKKIVAIFPPSPLKNSDLIVWSLSSNRAFEMKTAYRKLNEEPYNSERLYTLIWR